MRSFVVAGPGLHPGPERLKCPDILVVGLGL